MDALVLITLIGLVFLLGLFCGVYISLPKKKSWWAEKFIGLVKRYTNTDTEK